MKKNMLLLAAVAAFVGCKSGQKYEEPRNPAGLGQDSLASVDKSAARVSQVSVNSFTWSKNTAGLVVGSAIDLASGARDLVVDGVGISGNVATIVFDASGKVYDKTGSDVAVGWVVTTAGNVFEASLDGSKTAVNVSVEIAEDSGDLAQDAWEGSKNLTLNIWDGSKKAFIGTVNVSGRAAKKVWGWSKSGGQWAIDQSGNLIHSSGEVVGTVYTETGSKTAVGFVVDSTGKILNIASEKSVFIVTSSAKAVVDFSKSVWKGLKASPGYSVKVAKASAQKTMVILRDSSGKTIPVATTTNFQTTY